MERYGGGPIEVRDYDPAWPALFERERTQVGEALGEMVVCVEHVGSTAVPGLAAKPIIDVLVGVRSLDEARSRSVAPLEALGYIYLAQYQTWLPDEMLFRKGPPGPWTHHLHLTEPSSPRWEEFILIRDHLRRHPEIASAYADLKKALALVFEEDIVGYREAKRPFLQAVMARARAEGAST
jgi:GrpB-like predicted nucleotidyltransferase (UPF0157 family)